jgi:hypothetical protein
MWNFAMKSYEKVLHFSSLVLFFNVLIVKLYYSEDNFICQMIFYCVSVVWVVNYNDTAAEEKNVT